MIKKVVLFSMYLLFTACSFAQDDQKAFPAFWNQFQAAVINGDQGRVADMTRFPFETRGPVDSDPVRRHAREAFLKLYDSLMEEPVYTLDGGQVKTKTMRTVVEETKEISARHAPTDTFVRIESFEFQRLNGRWQFTRAYTEKP